MGWLILANVFDICFSQSKIDRSNIVELHFVTVQGATSNLWSQSWMVSICINIDWHIHKQNCALLHTLQLFWIFLQLDAGSFLMHFTGCQVTVPWRSFSCSMFLGCPVWPLTHLDPRKMTHADNLSRSLSWWSTFWSNACGCPAYKHLQTSWLFRWFWPHPRRWMSQGCGPTEDSCFEAFLVVWRHRRWCDARSLEKAFWFRNQSFFLESCQKYFAGSIYINFHVTYIL